MAHTRFNSGNDMNISNMTVGTLYNANLVQRCRSHPRPHRPQYLRMNNNHNIVAVMLEIFTVGL